MSSAAQKKRIGLMTGGGDAPGLNGIIEAVVRSLRSEPIEIVGIQDGFEGVFDRKAISLSADAVWGQHQQAGSILGASNKSRVKGREQEFVSGYKHLKLDGLIAAGGDGTFEGLSFVKDQIKVIGVPKTIDNDLSGTDVTFGYDTACTVVAKSVQALRATAETHRRFILVEAMGRTAGWIALGGGLAAYADVILIPERPFSRELLKKYLKEKMDKGRRGLLAVVAEGAKAHGEQAKVAFHVKDSPQSERFGGLAESLARWAEAEVGWESRHVVLGHLQRSEYPTMNDRLLTLQMGAEVAKAVTENDWNKAIVIRQGQIARAPISDLMQPPRLVSSQHPWVEIAQKIGIFI